MAAPNIVNVATITGKTAVLALTTSATAIVSNSASSGSVMRVNALYISNIDGANSATVNADIYRGATAYHVVKSVIVPAGASLDILSKHFYLEEGDSLRLTANANTRLEAVCSYEVIS